MYFLAKALEEIYAVVFCFVVFFFVFFSNEYPRLIKKTCFVLFLFLHTKTSVVGF